MYKRQAQLRSAQFAVEVARHEVEAAKTALRPSAAQPGDAARETVVVRATVDGQVPVSYTHLDVYKRQAWDRLRTMERRRQDGGDSYWLAILDIDQMCIRDRD